MSVEPISAAYAVGILLGVVLTAVAIFRMTARRDSTSSAVRTLPVVWALMMTTAALITFSMDGVRGLYAIGPAAVVSGALLLLGVYFGDPA